MDGVRLSSVCCVEWRWGVLLLARTVQWCGPRPAHPSAVLASAAVVSCYCSLPGVWCVGECVSVVFVWWGVLCLLPPCSGGGWGRRGWVGGMVSEGRVV